MGSGRLIRPAAEHDAEALDASCLDRVNPGELAGGVYRHRDKHALLEALTARAAALEMVEGRQTDCRIIEGDQLPDGAPVARFGTFGVGKVDMRPHLSGQARLCVDVGQGIGRPACEYVLVRDLEEREAGSLEESAPNPLNTPPRRCRRHTQRASVLTAAAAVWWSAGLSWPGFR